VQSRKENLTQDTAEYVLNCGGMMVHAIESGIIPANTR